MNRLRNPATWIGFLGALFTYLLVSKSFPEAWHQYVEVAQGVLLLAGAWFFNAGMMSTAQPELVASAEDAARKPPVAAAKLLPLVLLPFASSGCAVFAYGIAMVSLGLECVVLLACVALVVLAVAPSKWWRRILPVLVVGIICTSSSANAQHVALLVLNSDVLTTAPAAPAMARAPTVSTPPGAQNLVVPVVADCTRCAQALVPASKWPWWGTLIVSLVASGAAVADHYLTAAMSR